MFGIIICYMDDFVLSVLERIDMGYFIEYFMGIMGLDMTWVVLV